jgi:uncharacterized membrane protein
VDDVTIARALHVISVVPWIGGVAMVATVLLPAIGRLKSADEGLAFFVTIERRFAAEAKVTTLAVGATGVYTVARPDLWSRFCDVRFWWPDAMAAI